MTEVTIHEAKARFSRLLARVAEGEEVVITRGGEPIARIVAIKPRGSRRILGRDAGSIVIADDFEAPLDPETMSSR
jgi:prevent-host-death family protein